jgi:hypothetical protein
MIEVGDQVLIVAGGVSVMRVLEVRDDGIAVIESVLDTPGTYSFEMEVRHLVPIGD